MRNLRIILIVFILTGVSLAEDVGKRSFTATIDPDGTQKVTITGDSYFFDPNDIVVKVNVPVELSVTRVGGIVPHGISMDSPEAGMKFDESLGIDPKVIRFTPTKTGKFPFICPKKFLFTTHEERGMRGVIEVVQ